MTDSSGLKIKVAFLSVATRHYIDYWIELVVSTERILNADSSFTWHIFTDQVLRVEEANLTSEKLTIVTHPIPPLGWPEATMLRYQLFSECHDLDLEDILVYIDADMLVHGSFQGEVEMALKSDQMVLVAHPGYWRPPGTDCFKLYLKHPKILLGDVCMRIRIGGLGSWETRSGYSAFVPRRKRQIYVCGGIWLGSREKFLALCTNLARISNEEAQQGRIPIWHDESYLNKWASENSFLLLSPKLCFDPLYPQLRGIENVVEAVRKINIVT